jgi:hypothetical protein
MDMKTREMIVSLAMDLRRHHDELQIFRVLLRLIEKRPEILTNWRTIAENMLENPEPFTSERFAAKFQPFIDYALQGLSQNEAQELLNRVDRLHRGIQ